MPKRNNRENMRATMIGFNRNRQMNSPRDFSVISSTLEKANLELENQFFDRRVMSNPKSRTENLIEQNTMNLPRPFKLQSLSKKLRLNLKSSLNKRRVKTQTYKNKLQSMNDLELSDPNLSLARKVKEWSKFPVQTPSTEVFSPDIFVNTILQDGRKVMFTSRI
jgi:hypothetical protein